MGNIAAIAVGIASFLVVLLAGHVLGAFAFGVIMYAMAYGAFAWRPGEAPDKVTSVGDKPALGPVAPQATSEATTTLAGPQPPDISSLSPRDIGRGLAISLDTSCPLDTISDGERSLAQAAKIPLEKYYREVLVLSGFAQDYAIFRLIGHSEVGKEILAGYREAWQNVAKSGAAGAALFQLFVKRCPEYAKAAREDEEASEEGVRSLSRLSLVFGGNIQAQNSTPAEAGSAAMLAMAHAHTYYFAHFQGAAEALRSAKLLSG